MDFDFQNLHHSYLLIGSAEEARGSIESFFAKNGINLIGSPDYFVLEEKLFGIDEARKLSDSAIRRAFTEKKVFLIAPEKITLEAQNALLKAFEEPISNTHFFLVARDESAIISTLRSRMQTVRLKASEETSEANKFLKLSLAERMKFVKSFLDKEKNLPAFLDELLIALNKGADQSALEKVYKARLISDERGASPRIILEHISLVL